MKSLTIIISDLHVGGGPSDPGDDHVYQGDQLVRFIGELAERDAGKQGKIELFINGDFLEFAQTLQSAYQARSAKSWCSEAESLQKLNAILAGHPDIFRALGSLMNLGNQVTIAAGNHDVDLYWHSVRSALASAVHPALSFEIGAEWVERYGGKLQIAHGHIPDPANTFKNWNDPFVGTDSDRRLEMCAGTLFMVKFVNFLEKEYPFADNIYPVQRLANLLASTDKQGLGIVSWAFLKFAARHPRILSLDASSWGGVLMAKLDSDDSFASELAAATGLSVEAIRASAPSEEALAEFLLVHWPEIAALPAWKKIHDTNLLGEPGAPNTLGTIVSSASFGREALQEYARERAAAVDATEVVVLGHTHLPDSYQATHKARYFNPGSWTRYADVSRYEALTLEDLRDESKFPYSLNYVQIEQLTPDASLRATLETFERHEASFS